MKPETILGISITVIILELLLIAGSVENPKCQEQSNVYIKGLTTCGSMSNVLGYGYGYGYGYDYGYDSQPDVQQSGGSGGGFHFFSSSKKTNVTNNSQQGSDTNKESADDGSAFLLPITNSPYILKNKEKFVVVTLILLGSCSIGLFLRVFLK